MAYFHRNDAEETKRQQLNVSGHYSVNENEDYTESEYDDGFDDLSEEEDELSEDELKEIRRKRYHLASGAGNLTAVIAGTFVILILLALLMSMISFVMNDADRSFTLLQTRF